MGTPSGKLNGREFLWVVRDTALLAVAFFAAELARRAGDFDWGQWQPLVVLFFAALAHLAKHWATNNVGPATPIPGEAELPLGESAAQRLAELERTASINARAGDLLVSACRQLEQRIAALERRGNSEE